MIDGKPAVGNSGHSHAVLSVVSCKSVAHAYSRNSCVQEADTDTSNIRAGPRHVCVPGRLIIWSPLKPTFLNIVGLGHSLRNVLWARAKLRIILGKIILCVEA